MLERAQNVSEAIAVLDGLISSYGFGSEDALFAGESYIISDPEESWIVHIAAVGTSGLDAVWVAQKVPDGHFAVVPNVFIIRELDVSDQENFKTSSNILDWAITNGWNKDDILDFTMFFGKGEYSNL